jgi:S1-C subfamily serine protease
VEWSDDTGDARGDNLDDFGIRGNPSGHYSPAPLPAHERVWRHPSEVGQAQWSSSEPPLAIGRSLGVAAATLAVLLGGAVLWTLVPTGAQPSAVPIQPGTSISPAPAPAGANEPSAFADPSSAGATSPATAQLTPTAQGDSSTAMAPSATMKVEPTKVPQPTTTAAPRTQANPRPAASAAPVAVGVGDGTLLVTTAQAMAGSADAVLLDGTGGEVAAKLLLVDQQSGLAILRPSRPQAYGFTIGVLGDVGGAVDVGGVAEVGVVGNGVAQATVWRENGTFRLRIDVSDTGIAANAANTASAGDSSSGNAPADEPAPQAPGSPTTSNLASGDGAGSDARSDAGAGGDADESMQLEVPEGAPVLSEAGELIGLCTMTSDGWSMSPVLPIVDLGRLASMHTGAWLGWSVSGSTITDIAADSPAAQAGLVVGDRIEAINGRAVETDAEVLTALAAITTGDTVSVQIARDTNQPNTSQPNTSQPNDTQPTDTAAAVDPAATEQGAYQKPTIELITMVAVEAS